MASILQELQWAASDSSIPITDLLRKALIVARKLKLAEFRKWCEGELDGFESDELPEYRHVTGQMQCWNPFYRTWIPLLYDGDVTIEEFLVRRWFHSTAAEIESLIKDCTIRDYLAIEMPPHQVLAVMRWFNCPLPPRFIVQKNVLCGILDTVRNTVLNWSLQLEEDGIFGEGLSFSPEERKAAAQNSENLSPSFIINNYNGNTENSLIQQGSPSAKQKYRRR